MKLKIVDLELLLTFDHMWKILVWLLRSVFWFVNVLLSLKVLYVSLTRINYFYH